MKKFPLLALEEILARSQKIPSQLRGIYFLIDGDRVMYVGQTPNVFRRIGEHLGRAKRERYYLLPMSEDATSDKDLSALERRYIDHLNPPLNIQKGFHENITPPSGQRSTNATKRALELVDRGHTAYAAAKREGISLSTIYRALARRRNATPDPSAT